MTELEAVIADRNARCFAAWRLRLALRREHPDAWPPVWRERLTAWFAEHRGNAMSWLFKLRCAKRAALRHHDWSKRYRT